MEKRNFKTEGEEYLADFFRRYKIQYQHQKRIDGLKEDKADYRIADFFLPGLNVYVEYNGQYFLPQHQERYKEKQRIYRENNIPCVFVFPENLGVLEFIFDKRLIAVLKAFHLSKELKKYRTMKLLKSYERIMVILFMAAIQFLAMIDNQDYDLTILYVISAVVIIYQLARIVNNYYRIFYLDQYPLGKQP